MVRRFDLNAMNWLELLLEMTLRASFLNWEVRRSFPARDPPAARWDRQPYRPRTPCGRSKPSLAHLPCPVHVTRLLHPCCSCGTAFARRRLVCDETFESGDDPGLCRHALAELRLRGRIICCAASFHARPPCARAPRPRAPLEGKNMHSWRGACLYCGATACV